MKKKHKHEWDTDGDYCENCKYYIEHCVNLEAVTPDGSYCFEARICSPEGKCKKL